VACAGRLAAHPGSGGGWRALLADTAYAAAGTFALGRIPLGPEEPGWRRLRALAGPLPAGTHVRLFTRAAAGAAPAPGPPAEGDGWHAAPPGALDLLVEEADAYLWIGGRLESDGAATPVLRQLVLESD